MLRPLGLDLSLQKLAHRVNYNTYNNYNNKHIRGYPHLWSEAIGYTPAARLL